MLLKKAVYKKILVKRNRLVEDEIHGCDECKEEIKNYPNEPSRLDLTVFQESGETSHLHFCSWDCALKHLPKIKSDNFISLPMATFHKHDGFNRGKAVHKRSGKRLMQILKTLA